MLKSNPGQFFEDFRIGQLLRHATPRTVTDGDVALYTSLTGSRYALYSADTFAQALSLPAAPVDPLLVFHVVFGKTVPDISLNAVANLGYADGRFLAAVAPGDTLTASSEVIGLKENSNRRTGVVHVRTTGFNQHGTPVLSYVRWVMVNKRDEAAPAPEPVVPELPSAVAAAALVAPPAIGDRSFDPVLSGSPHAYEDYAVGERIDHVDGMTVQEAEHQIATRLYQNTARVHFDALAQSRSRHGRRLIYGGVVISLARALAFNGLGNAAQLLAVNAGRHVNPLFAGATVYAWSEVLDRAELGGNWGALRLRHVATKDRPAVTFPGADPLADPDPSVILDFDCWAAIPKRAAFA